MEYLTACIWTINCQMLVLDSGTVPHEIDVIFFPLSTMLARDLLQRSRGPLVPLTNGNIYEWHEVGRYCGETVVELTAPVAIVALPAGGAAAVPQRQRISLLAFT